jgi:predicted phage tail protein
MMTLEGKKTYITAVVLALGSFAMAMGWLSQEQYQVIVGLLASLGLAALRSGVAKSTTDKAKAGEADEAAVLPD